MTLWTSAATTLTTDHGAHVSQNHWGQEGTVQGDTEDIISNNANNRPRGPGLTEPLGTGGDSAG